MKTHLHICGDTGNTRVFKFDSLIGCGHVFKHISSKRHVCPKCKKPVAKTIVTRKELETLKNEHNQLEF